MKSNAFHYWIQCPALVVYCHCVKCSRRSMLYPNVHIKNMNTVFEHTKLFETYLNNKRYMWKKWTGLLSVHIALCWWAHMTQDLLGTPLKSIKGYNNFYTKTLDTVPLYLELFCSYECK